MSDQFFEDEDSLSGEAHVPAPAKGKSTSASAARGKGASPHASAARAKAGSTAPHAKAIPAQTGMRRPPSFFMVVVITIVALVLGFCLGYFTALNTWSSKLEADHATTAGTTQGAAAGTDGAATINEEAGLPEGHPDLASLMNADGSIDEEKLAAYKAQLEAAKAASGADGASSSASND